MRLARVCHPRAGCAIAMSDRLAPAAGFDAEMLIPIEPRSSYAPSHCLSWMTVFGAQRKRVNLLVGFCSSRESRHSRYGHLTARFAPKRSSPNHKTRDGY
jgi:hypothetical protein